MAPLPRFKVDYPVTIHRLWKNQVHPAAPARIQVDSYGLEGRTNNVSLSGIAIDLSRVEGQVQAGDEYQIRIHLTGSKEPALVETISIRVRAIWKKQGRCGFQVLEMSGPQAMAYHRFVENYAALLTISPVGHRAA